MSAALERVEPGLEPPRPRATPAAGPLGMVELLDRDGGVAHRIAIRHWPVTIGRAIDCDVVLDDPHAAAHHARIERPVADEPPRLVVGETRNGARLRGERLAAGAQAALPAGSEWLLGRTRLRLRLAGESLPAEQPLRLPSAGRARRIGLGVLALVAWQAGLHWLQSDPGDSLAGYLPALLALPIGLAIWSFLWAVGSKLFARHFDFAAHLQLALGVLLASLLLDALLPLAAFTMSWEWLGRAGLPLALALGCGLLFGHMSLVVPGRQRALASGFAVMFVVGTALQLAMNFQRGDRWFGPLYLTTLGPPGLRLAPAVAPRQFLEEARALQAPLDERARDTDVPWLGDDDSE